MGEHPVETILQYHFSNSELLDEALLAVGAVALSKDIEGDVVLELWYNSEESTNKGYDRVKNLCRNTKLSQIAHRSGISSYITKNPSQEGQVPQETAASTIEALVGAIYLDSGKDISMVKKALKVIGFFKAS
ncbi:hypothetical protein J3E71DRAFT_390634 [Bipolaris maydis]|nr:hypothetical protein J3E71DRAFT_390634 [Bipolaris maydis]